MSTTAAISELQAPETIRARCRNVLVAGLAGRLDHFVVDLTRLPELARLTAEVTRRRYPSLDIPPHSRFAHFDAGGVPRLSALEAELSSRPPDERARALIDVVVTSVLLDAGAGMAWRYHEPETGLSLSRSEGLAVASLAWVKRGGLSSRGEAYHVDAEGLSAVDEAGLAEAFQVRADNPLVGVPGRVHLLQALARSLRTQATIFGPRARPGGLLDFLRAQAEFCSPGDPPGATRTRLPAAAILRGVLAGLGEIWPGRLSLEGQSLGDVWQHPAAGGEGPTRGLVPFHKLSQWLSYSLIYALEAAGLSVVELDALTGLAEYRNGGLFVDGKLLLPRHREVFGKAHEVSSEVVVEWRALTVALLDELLPVVRRELETEITLAALLEGGSWAAGRELALTLRADGGPPIRVLSDGTVF
jgi:hypothetical protein